MVAFPCARPRRTPQGSLPLKASPLERGKNYLVAAHHWPMSQRQICRQSCIMTADSRIDNGRPVRCS